MQSERVSDGNMEQSWPEKRTIRFRGTGKSKTHVSSHDRRVESVDPPHRRPQLSDGQDARKKKQRKCDRDNVIVGVLCGAVGT